MTRRLPTAQRSATLRARQVLTRNDLGDFVRAPDAPIARMFWRSAVRSSDDVTLAATTPWKAGDSVMAGKWEGPK